MGKGYEKAKGRSKSSFVLLTHSMMDSPAWRDLPATAQALWLHIRRRFNGNRHC